MAICNIRKWTTNPKIYLMMALLMMLIWQFMDPLRWLSQALGANMTPYVFVFWVNTPILQLVMMLGLVLLFCDAPFLDRNQQYSIIRSGRMKWGVAQVLYIMIATLLYVLAMVAISIGMLLPQVEWSGDWGSLVLQLSNPELMQQYGYSTLVTFSMKICRLYDPLEALLLTVFLEWCAGCILGLVMFVVNRFAPQGVGVVCGALVAVTDLASMGGYAGLSRISPATLARLGALDNMGYTDFPTVSYAIAAMLIGIGVLSVLAVLSVRWRSVDKGSSLS